LVGPPEVLLVFFWFAACALGAPFPDSAGRLLLPAQTKSNMPLQFGESYRYYWAPVPGRKQLNGIGSDSDHFAKLQQH
jgi:hypothetical protein